MKLRTVPFLVMGAFCLLAFASCESNPNLAFPTARAVAAHPTGGQALDVAILERGRKIYTTSCTECHVARPIANYSIAQWRHYVGIMAPRAGLKPHDRAALETYIIAARESLPPG